MTQCRLLMPLMTKVFENIDLSFAKLSFSVWTSLDLLLVKKLTLHPTLLHFGTLKKAVENVRKGEIACNN